MCPEALEDFLDDLPVSGKVRVRNEDVVEVDHDISGQDEVLEDVVRRGLGGRQRIGQAEVHHQGFKEPPVSTEGGLPLVTFLNADIVRAHQTPSFVKNWAPFKRLMKSLIRGSGYWFFKVITLSAQ